MIGRRSLLIEGISKALEKSEFDLRLHAESFEDVLVGDQTIPRNQVVLFLQIVDDLVDAEDAFRTTARIHKQFPAAVIVIINQSKFIDSRRIWASGASACLYASSNAQQLIFLLQVTLMADRGFFILPRQEMRPLVFDEGSERIPPPPSNDRRDAGPPDTGGNGLRLSPRECDVLFGLCQGESNKALARKLAISDATVKTHVRAVFRKLNARNRTQAVRRVLALCPSGSNIDTWLRSSTKHP